MEGPWARLVGVRFLAEAHPQENSSPLSSRCATGAGIHLPPSYRWKSSAMTCLDGPIMEGLISLPKGSLLAIA